MNRVLNIYVATSYKNIAEAREVMTALREAGHKITHDWTREKVDPAWPPEEQERYTQFCGAQDFVGVEQADLVVLINHPDARDAMCEFGQALGRGQLVFVLYPERRGSVFFHRARCTGTLEELLWHLRGFV